jgi:uncharacterized protein YkwD
VSIVPSPFSRRRSAVLTVAVTIALLATACAGTARLPHSAGSPGLPGNAREQQLELDLIARVNAERAARGLRQLVVDANLTNAAYGWSHTMAAQNTMYHSDLNAWINPFIADAENIAWETSPGMSSGDMHVMWMRSDGHRHNILAPNLTHVGIGIVCVNGKMWGTERFGSTASPDFGGLPPVNPIARADRGGLGC